MKWMKSFRRGRVCLLSLIQCAGNQIDTEIWFFQANLIFSFLSSNLLHTQTSISVILILKLVWIMFSDWFLSFMPLHLLFFSLDYRQECFGAVNCRNPKARKRKANWMSGIETWPNRLKLQIQLFLSLKAAALYSFNLLFIQFVELKERSWLNGGLREINWQKFKAGSKLFIPLASIQHSFFSLRFQFKLIPKFEFWLNLSFISLSP